MAERERLSYQDAAFLNFERKTYPLVMGSVGIYEGRLRWEDYLSHINRRLERIPRYRQRMVRVPLNLAHPLWIDDPDFDVRNQVTRIRLPAPGSDRQLAKAAGEFFAKPMDTRHPLWEIQLVQGLSGGRTAHLATVHHCLADGVAGAGLLQAVLDLTPNPEEEPEPSFSAPPLPSRAALMGDALWSNAVDALDLVEHVQLAAVDPRSYVRGARSIARALWDARSYLTRPAPRTPWRTKLSGGRQMAWQEFEFAEARAIRSELNGTVNDVALTVLAGGLGRYLRAAGYDTEGVVLRAMTPVNVRTQEHGVLGNRVSMMIAGLPVGVTDPKKRFRIIHREMGRLKENGQSSGFYNLARLAGLTAAPLQALSGRVAMLPNFWLNIVCTNVPGPLIPLYCIGHRMIAHYPWVPLGWQMGLGVAVMTYDRSISFGLAADTAVLPDLERLPRYLEQSFAELRKAAGVAATATPATGRTSRPRSAARGATTGTGARAAEAGEPPVPPHLRAAGAEEPAATEEAAARAPEPAVAAVLGSAVPG